MAPSSPVADPGCRSLLEAILRPIEGPSAAATAQRLLAAFRTIGAVLTAGGPALAGALPDRREAIDHLCAIREGMVQALRSEVLDAPVLSTSKAVIEYLFALMAHLRVEQIRVLFLDAANRLIADEAVSQGSVREATIPIRDILGRAIAHDATALILVHNHPSGQLRPSPDDIAVTHRVTRATRELGIQLHDHLIVGRTGVASFRELGLLDGSPHVG